jgi:magnesium transporter
MVLTFHHRGAAWNSIHQRIKAKGSRLRRNDASFLAYSLLDAVVDRCFPILEHYSDRAEELETLILERSGMNALGEIHQLKRDLLLLRWAIYARCTGAAAPHECRVTPPCVPERLDHVVQIIEIVRRIGDRQRPDGDLYVLGLKPDERDHEGVARSSAMIFSR